MEFKILNLENFDLNKITNYTEKEKEKEIDIFEETKNIYYSYPYLSHDDIDYQFRIITNNDCVNIDEIKNNNIEDLDSIVVIKSFDPIDIEDFNEYLYKFIDFRDTQAKLYDGIINLNISNTKNEIIKQNKIYVLYDLYNDLIE